MATDQMAPDQMAPDHYVKHRSFTKFPVVQIWWKLIVSTEKTVSAIHPELCVNCTFPQNFCARKLGKMVFYVVDA